MYLTTAVLRLAVFMTPSLEHLVVFKIVADFRGSQVSCQENDYILTATLIEEKGSRCSPLLISCTLV